MKYPVGFLVVVLVVTGIFFGFKLANNTETGNISGDTAVQSGSNVLDLSNKGLTKVSSDVYSQNRTTDLILSNNSIRTLPSEMGKLTNLTILKIDHNLLEGSLIGEIRQMPKLRLLDVSYNNMTGMPAEIGQLGSLQTLNYSYNKITDLPNELSKLKNNLKEFNLTGNPLSQDKINKLKSDLPDTNIIF